MNTEIATTMEATPAATLAAIAAEAASTTSVAVQDVIRADVLPGKFVNRRLAPRHMAIVEMALGGLNSPQIAEKLNLDKRTVEIIIRSPIVQHELAMRRQQLIGQSNAELIDKFADARDLMEIGTYNAVERLVTLVDSPNENVALKAATSIIDRTFGSEKELSLGANKTVVNINVDRMDLLVKAMKEDRE